MLAFIASTIIALYSPSAHAGVINSKCYGYTHKHTYRIKDINGDIAARIKVYHKPLSGRDKWCAITIKNKSVVGTGKFVMDIKAGTKAGYTGSIKWLGSNYRDHGYYTTYAGGVTVQPGWGRCAVFYGAIKVPKDSFRVYKYTVNNPLYCNK